MTEEIINHHIQSYIFYTQEKYEGALECFGKALDLSPGFTTAVLSTGQALLNPNLSLRVLAEMVDIPSNHLSRLLNEGFDKNFSEFVNFYRLETFKAKVANPALEHLTLLGLAYESGFNSKTVCNSFFKKVMGISPKAYQKKVMDK